METQAKSNFLYDDVLPRVELISWLVVGAGLVLRCFFLLPGGNTLLMTGLGSLAIAYFLRAFEPSNADIADEYAFSNASFALPPSEGFIAKLSRQVLAFSSGIIFLGVLFKLLFWKGAALMLPVGIGMVVLVIAWQSSIGSLTRRTVLVAGLGVFAWAVPPDALARQLFRNDPILAGKLVFQQQHPHDQVAAQEVKRLMWMWHKRKR